MAWRLGLDLGTNSLGWVAVRLDEQGEPCGFLAAGSRIFSDGRDPKSKASLAVDRRDARAMRRRRDRFKQRQRALIKYLIRDGLFPENPAERRALAALDPYEMRARALDEALTPGEIARVIFHLNQRRGFKSNRKADRGKSEREAEAGKVETGISNLKARITQAEEQAGAEPGSWTFGKWLHHRRQSAASQNAIPPVRTRVREAAPDDKNDIYDFYPGRDLIAEEFEAIWQAQARFHPALLTSEAYDHLYEIVFFQRPLKQPRIGKCTLLGEEERLPKAHPLFQRRRLLEEVNALMLVRPGAIAERLTPEERDRILLKFHGKAKVTFKALYKELKLDSAARFNKDSAERPELKGDEVAATMATKSRFDTRWFHLSVDAQWDVIKRQQAVETDADDAAFRTWLTDTYALSAEQAVAVAKAHLPQGFGRFGRTATAGLIEALRDGRDPQGRVLVYSEAVRAAGFAHHSDFRDGQVFTDKKGNPALPYYGVALERHIMPGTANPDDPEEQRIGRLTNPTVHIGLNQLRRVVNALIRAYGPPAQIALELARELKLSEDEKKKRNAENGRNRVAAEGRSSKLVEIGWQDTGAARARLKLWEELSDNVLDRRCPYSGIQIGIDMLFSDQIEIDHILPFAATLDDGNANKTVCLREANRVKRRLSPWDARFALEAHFGEAGSWDAIAERAARLPRNKRWRFEPDAMEQWNDEEKGFLARQLVDTQYLGRLAREYLVTLYPGAGEGTSHVWVSPGRLTELVRRKLGLNTILDDDNIGGSNDQRKNRLDHRHHAIDAAVVAIVDRSMLQRIATASGREGQDGAEKIDVPPPWEGFRTELRDTLHRVTVAHRPDTGTIVKRVPGAKLLPDQTAGRLHNDTAYGFTGDTDAKGNTIVVRRVPLSALKKAADLDAIRDVPLRDALRDFTAGFEGKAFERMIADFPILGPLDYRGIRRVRKTEPLAVIPIHDAAGRAYKGYKGDSNYRYDVWQLPDGKWVTSWQTADGIAQSSIVSMFDAHQPGDRPRPHPAARKVLSLQQNDMVAIEAQPGDRRLLRVVKFGQDGRLYLAEAQESGALKARDADKSDPFAYVSLFPAKQKAWRARQVRIDELGRVLDPGFPARKSVRSTHPRG